ncbi:MAG TPA: hypothetical protein PLZ84_01195 [Clostridia bacterium]|nr:hypothetical protein [Clostridia bacterium]
MIPKTDFGMGFFREGVLVGAPKARVRRQTSGSILREHNEVARDVYGTLRPSKRAR